MVEFTVEKEAVMGLYNPEVHLWTITHWYAREVAPHDYSFTLWASPRFIQAARDMHYDPVELQDEARKLVRHTGAGFQISGRTDPLNFSEHDLESFEVPGDGCCVIKTNLTDGSAIYRSHNVDTVQQQVALLSLWFLWAQLVEKDLWTKIGGASIASAMQM